MYKFGVLGNDPRMRYACEHLRRRGCDAVMCEDNFCGRNALILPAGEKCDGRFDGYTVFGKDGKFDYLKNEYFKHENAYPTACGALLIAMQNTDRVLRDCRSVITGSGNIAKCLCHMMRALDLPVTVCARRDAQYVFEDIPRLCPDFIFNTVPAQVLTRDILSQLNNTKIIELASAPYGADSAAARECGVEVIPAGGLPGRFFPCTAGKILADTVILMAEVE